MRLSFRNGYAADAPKTLVVVERGSVAQRRAASSFPFNASIFFYIRGGTSLFQSDRAALYNQSEPIMRGATHAVCDDAAAGKRQRLYYSATIRSRRGRIRRIPQEQHFQRFLPTARLRPIQLASQTPPVRTLAARCNR